MRAIVILSFIVLIFTSFQVREKPPGHIGSTRSEIIEDFSTSPGAEGFKLNYNEKDRLLMTYDKKLKAWIHFGFDNNDVCEISAIQYDIQEGAQWQIAVLDNDATKISNTEWEFRRPNGKNITVSLIIKQGVYSFVYNKKGW